VSTIVGVGIDAVELDRMRKVLTRTPRIVTRAFTEGERDYCLGRKDPTERFAVRFAAKEAVMKAMGVGLGAFSFQDVEVTRSESGAPALVVRGAAAALAADRGVREWRISLTHTSAVAEAVVLAL
jgi:holo-[acyl-carrier protein] synthase